MPVCAGMLAEGLSLRVEAATVIDQGRRDAQEDAVVADFGRDGTAGFAVLADGMGGHAAGDVASALVLHRVRDYLGTAFSGPDAPRADMAALLQLAMDEANADIADHAYCHPETQGMGATLLVPVIRDGALYWVSVGDSPLFLMREDRLYRLNRAHTLAARLDAMVRDGTMDAAAAQATPDRDALTSVLIGAPIPEVDLRATPFALCPGDIVLAASDGLEFLDDAQIATVLNRYRDAPSHQIAAQLMQAVHDLDDPDQDNTALCVIKVSGPQPAPRMPRAATAQPARRKTTLFMRVQGNDRRVAFGTTSAREGK
ncbi:serine/threonine-protein phosphatase [Arenibacterium halophilum]|uniref:Serine/threonine-protein phosphatase n=2 Tax=Arenibacterium halophilum TaxID=2583821 RepID=A0ABY2X6T2_9RHOB|nr:serine/threonine-protein phosphatase [Arenibacterium halophilum]